MSIVPHKRRIATGTRQTPPHQGVSVELEEASQRFLHATRDPGHAQLALLEDTLRCHRNTEYGRKLGFGTIHDVATFRARAPVVTYADLEPYIERMLAGEPNVLVEGQPVFFGQTTGTTGRPKRIGFHARAREDYLHFVGPGVTSLARAYPGSLERSLYVTAQYLEEVSATGIPIGQASGFVRHTFAPLFQSVPDVVYESKDYDARYYAILRFALSESLVCASTLYPSILLNLFDRVSDHATELAHDLRNGTLCAGPGDLSGFAAGAGGRLTPKPACATRLQDIIRVHGQFVPEEYWPELRVLQVWKGGSAKHYLAELRRRCPNVAMRPALSGSTEGALLVPLADDWSGGVPALLSTFFEFFPEGAEPSADAFVPLQELEENRGYRVVITNNRGLYRYLMDDVFVVEGSYLATPILRFSHRAGTTTSVAGEKLTEAHIIAAVEAASAACALSVRAYDVAPEPGTRPRYSIAVELGTDIEESGPLRLFLVNFESQLRKLNISYDQYRRSGLLRHPVLYVMRRGYYESVRRDRALTTGRSDAQVKAAVLSTSFVERDPNAINRAVSF